MATKVEPTQKTDPRSALEAVLRSAIAGVSGEAPESIDALLAPARDLKFGDFQCNAAMPTGKALGRPPREVAQQIVDALQADTGFAALADAPEIAGPGFINIRLKPEVLAAALEHIDTEAIGIQPPDAPPIVVVDLCGVNLAKQMHVGHLRATVIGDALARLHERLGHRVIRQNHFGDWGLPIAMVTRAIRLKMDAGTLDLDTLTLDTLESIYREAQRACAADRKGLATVKRFSLGPKAQAEVEAQVEGALAELEQAKQALIALQQGDAELRRIWERIAQVTLAACFENCAKLGANVTSEATAGESSYSEELAPLIDDLVKRNIAEENEGALIIRLDESGIREPLLVRKSDGGFLYATTDLAALRRRVQTLRADRVLYAVDARQSLHFRQVFAAATKAGFTHKPDGGAGTLLHAEVIHAAFGTVLGEDGRPFKTRSGENVKLSDLLDEAVRRADEAVAEKNPELPEQERTGIATAVGIGAIKYADLSTDRIKDYTFDFDRMLAFEGNTGPYLQYAGVRIASIFRNARDRFGIELDDDFGPFRIDAAEEKTIALALLRYPGVIEAAASACEPHRVCAYLYELASAFSTFFAACPVLQAETDHLRRARLRLCRLTGLILKDGLTTLGITPLERM